MKSFRVQIITPEITLYDESASSLSVPGTEGRMVVMHSHEEMIVSLKPGKVRVTDDAGKHTEYNLSGMGTLDISSTTSIIFANKINPL